ncbi:MAG: hypothetical protein WCA22_01705 [Candidatus Binatus sp.]
MRGKIKRAIVTSMTACAIALAGCWHQETQQQKFVEAMNHGNSAQASQIWLHMDAKSRQDFAHNQGMQPNMSPDDVKKQVTQHYQDEMGGNEDSGEAVEKPTPNVHLGGLESLPEWVGPSGAPPQSVTVPAQTAPSN